MNEQDALTGTHNETEDIPPVQEEEPFDFAFVPSTARIALYDDLKIAPRVTEIEPAETGAYIETLATTIYNQSKSSGGSIPYTVIREVSENFIHARFQEVVVSILDHGNTIRFADQGPGIACKDKAQLPGFSSAIEPMKSYIRGVGSGLPIVKEYLEFSHGSITIEDNLGCGSVVTISLSDNPDESPHEKTPVPEQRQDAGFSNMPYGNNNQDPRMLEPNQQDYRSSQTMFPTGGGAYGAGTPQQLYPQGFPYNQQASVFPTQGMYQNPGFIQGQAYQTNMAGGYQREAAVSPMTMRPAVSPLSDKEQSVLILLYNEGCLGVTDIARILGMAGSSTHATLKKLEQAGLVIKNNNQKREITQLGRAAAESLL